VHVGSIGPEKPLIESGKIRLLAVSSESRLEGPFAKVPTWKEQGISGTFSTWRGLWAPKGLRPEEVAFWDQTLSRFARSKEWQQELDKREWVNDYRSSRETQRYLQQLETDLKEVLKDLGLMKE
jgi:putative tricarboxylic transport membrane protein